MHQNRCLPWPFRELVRKRSRCPSLSSRLLLVYDCTFGTGPFACRASVCSFVNLSGHATAHIEADRPAGWRTIGTCAGSRSKDLSLRALWRSECAATCGVHDASAAADGPRTGCWCRPYSETPDEHYTNHIATVDLTERSKIITGNMLDSARNTSVV